MPYEQKLRDNGRTLRSRLVVRWTHGDNAFIVSMPIVFLRSHLQK